MKTSPGWSNIRPKPSCPLSCALRYAGLFARGRTEVRATRHPQATENGRPNPGQRRHRRDRAAASPDPHPPTLRSAAARPSPFRPAAGVTPAGSLPGRAVRRSGFPERRKKARIDHVQPHRRVPVPRTVLTKGEGRLRGSCCRGPVDVVVRTAWEGRRHGACLRRRSRVSPCPPAWCRVGAEARQGEVVCREHPGVPPSSRCLAATDVRTVPRAED